MLGMKNQRVQRGVSKAEWLEAALEALAHGSVAGVTIQSLAKKLGIARAGFYWHFQDRDDLLRQLQDYWVHEVTEVLSANKEILALAPKARFIRTAELILKHDLVRYEVSFHQWGMDDAGAAKVLKKVRKMKMDFAKQALSELGFSGEELEMRAMLFVCYQTWESVMFADVSKKRRQALIARRFDLITRP